MRNAARKRAREDFLRLVPSVEVADDGRPKTDGASRVVSILISLPRAITCDGAGTITLIQVKGQCARPSTLRAIQPIRGAERNRRDI